MGMFHSKEKWIDEVGPDQVKRDFEEYEREDARTVKFRRGRLTPSVKALKVLGTTELSELITSYPSIEDILSLHDVNIGFRDIICTSSTIPLGQFFRKAKPSVRLNNIKVSSLLAFQIGKRFNKQGAHHAKLHSFSMPSILDHRLESIQLQCRPNLDLGLLTEIATALDDKTPFVIAGQDFNWHLRAFEPIGYAEDAGWWLFSQTRDNATALFVHLIAIDKNHEAGFHGCRVLQPSSAVAQMFLASRQINIPVFVRVDLSHDDATDLYDDLHTQSRFRYRNGDFEREWDQISEPTLVVSHDPSYKTYVVPWEYEGKALGYQTIDETDFESPWIDETFNADVRVAELLRWTEKTLKMQLAKFKYA